MRCLRIFFFIFIYCLLVNSCPVLGQEVSKTNLDSCWHKIGNVAVSENGQWLVYTKLYNDSTQWILKNKDGLKPDKKFKMVFLCGFVKSNGFVTQSGNNVEIHNLHTDDIEYYKNVRNFPVANHWDNGVYIYQKEKTLTFYTGSLVKQQWENVEQFQFNENKDQLIIQKNKQWLFYKRKKDSWSLIRKEENKPEWIKLMFTAKGYWYLHKNNQQYYVCVVDEGKLLEYTFSENFEEGYRLIPRWEDLEWDGFRFWFKLDKEKSTLPEKNKAAAEVWKGSDKLLYPVKEYMKGSILGCFVAKNNKIVLFKDTVTSNYVKVNKGNHVLMYNSLTHLKYIQHDDPLTAVLYESDPQKPVLKLDTLSPYKINMTFTDNMNKMVLFKENSWWVYEIEHKKWVNLSLKMKGAYFDNQQQSKRELIAPYYSILSSDEKTVYLHDAYDVWEIQLEDYTVKRLTNGRENKIVYRINESSYEYSRMIPSWNWTYQYKRSIGKPLLFQMESKDKTKQGIAYLKGSALETLVYSDAHYTSVQMKDRYVTYVSETFNTKPELWFIDLKTFQNKKILTSNQNCGDISWGKAQMITYEVDGDFYSAALFYPKDYDVSKKYPMIVNFYEAEAERKHEFVAPNYQYGDGFNKTDYSLNGYFVLIPDIHYKLSLPGTSAVKHLEQSVYKAISIASIDSKAIGLLAHSFGGYQVNFVIGHSNLFSAAVSSAGISDLVSWYFHISANTQRPEYWRMEGQQLRMGKSFFEMKENYVEQSPIWSADKIQTPLLLVAGKSDQHVVYTQTIEMYLALYRLQKPVIMLLYPDEAHGLLKNENNIDLRNKVMQWFDYYLKKKEEPEWSKKGN